MKNGKGICQGENLYANEKTINTYSNEKTGKEFAKEKTCMLMKKTSKE